MANIAYRDLLPPYMSHQAWQDLADAVETLFDENVTPWVGALAALRHSFIGDRTDSNSPLAAALAARDLIPDTAYTTFDVTTERLRLNMLGCRLSSVVGSDPETLARFTRHVGSYWQEKGTSRLTDFLAFCTNSNVTVDMLWTTDYVDFSATPGTPVWEGGAWYPTTHVDLTFDGVSFDADVPSFIRFFYDLANYNVVIRRVKVDRTVWMESPRHAVATVVVREHVAGNISVIGLPYDTLFTGIVGSDANLRGSTLANFEAESLGWPGTLTNAYLYNGGLRDSGTLTWDALAGTWDAAASWDGPSNGNLSYEHTPVDLGSVMSVNLAESHYADGVVTVTMSTSSDGTTWSGWTPLASQATARFFKIKWFVTGSDPSLYSAHVDFYL